MTDNRTILRLFLLHCHCHYPRPHNQGNLLLIQGHHCALNTRYSHGCDLVGILEFQGISPCGFCVGKDIVVEHEALEMPVL